jgi:hypothetical protein
MMTEAVLIAPALSDMRYVPPYTLLRKWVAEYAVEGNPRLTLPYDDLLDVVKGFLEEIPVDDDWYKAEYPAIAGYLLRMPTETPASHFRKHGYFEGRRPFLPGWRGLTDPVPFAQMKTRLRIIPARGRLRVDIGPDDLLEIIRTLLMAVPIDGSWYQATYSEAAEAIAGGLFASAADHYARQGYFNGNLPFDPVVDEEWYVSRYDHVRVGLSRGHEESAQDHFKRLGYNEGCRPTPP